MPPYEDTELPLRSDDFYPDDEVPEHVNDDMLLVYFRARFGDRNRLLERLQAVDRERVFRELRRVAVLREGYSSREENKAAEIQLELLRTKWRTQAINLCQVSRESLSQRVMLMRKLPAWERARRKQWEDAILQKVKVWDKQPAREPPLQSAPNPNGVHSREDNMRSGRPQPREWSPHAAIGLKKFKTMPTNPLDGYGINVAEYKLRKEDFMFSYGHFSVAGYPLQDILHSKEDNPIRQNGEPHTLRYYHFPANSMHWVEEVIGRYYGEETPGEYDYPRHRQYREHSGRLLRREYWTSLQHGGSSDPIHARYMRPHCSLVMNGESGVSGGFRGSRSRDFVIFMPYLHWETEKNRRNMARIINKIPNNRAKYGTQDEILKTTFNGVFNISNFDHDMDVIKRPNVEERSRPSQRSQRRPLGEYLLHVAKFYDSLDVDPNVRLLCDQLFADPCLHPRRTLHQSYYWRREHTDNLDRDQLTQKATEAGKDPQRIGRVIMVDQLWMYVLDQNTIISFFPQRAGRNFPDHSGVHAAIRLALSNLQPGQIHTVHDLALLIINECSSIFFDRTKPLDERPELLDILSNALSDVSDWKQLTLERFHHYLSQNGTPEKILMDLETTARKVLGTGHEVMLTKKLHDIVDELRMMSRIILLQKQVTSDFAEHLRNIYEQEQKIIERGSRNEDLLHIMREIKELLKGKSEPQGSPQVDPPVFANFTPHWQYSIPQNTIEFANRVSQNISKRRGELEELENTADMLLDQLKDHVNLKQQQASIMEAQYASNLAEEGVKQNRTVMLFTIVTIIFLPLSFMSSLFGMNASDFQNTDGSNSMSLRDQFKYLFSISTGVIVISIAFAFSARIRYPLYYFFSCISIGWAYFTEYTRLHELFSWCFPKPNETMRRDHKKIIHNIHFHRVLFQKQKQAVIERRRRWERSKRRLDASAEKEIDMREMIARRTSRGRGRRGEPSSAIDEELGH